MGVKCFLAISVFAVSALMASGHSITSGLLSSVEFNNNMVHHFETFDKVRHPREASKDNWMDSRTYITNFFKYIGLETSLQCFNTSVTLDYENSEEVTGCNVIGIANAGVTKNILVVGADYDSSGSTINHAALRDNGVGISMLLEIARAYHMSYQYRGWAKNYTTIFVGFDLNTAEQYPESSGHSGSYHFVHEYLEPMLMTNRVTLGGSIILDSIASYNTEPMTQNLPSDFKSIFPDAFDRIDNSSRRGDFLAVVSPSDSHSQELLQEFVGHYRMDRMARPYRLQEMVAGTREFGADSTYKTLNHQASYHFWTAKPVLPSILVTDTGETRILPGVEGECSTTECNYIFASTERMTFLYSTYMATAYTILDRQMTFVGLVKSGSSQLMVSMFTLVLSALLARFL